MNQNFSLSSDDVAVLCISLDQLIKSKMEDAPLDKKIENNSYAVTALNKLNNHETNFDSQDLRILYISLKCFSEYLLSVGPVNDDPELAANTKKYFSITNRLIKMIEDFLRSKGYEIR